MPAIKILKDTVCGGKIVKAGDVIPEASFKDAKVLIDLGKAELAGADKDAAEAENRDQIELQTRAPKAAMTTKNSKGLKG
jgi:hypothetical protein